jgi:hypothetical protein
VAAADAPNARAATAAAALIRRLRLFSGMREARGRVGEKPSSAGRPRAKKSDQDYMIDIPQFRVGRTAKNSGIGSDLRQEPRQFRSWRHVYYATMAIFRTAMHRRGNGARGLPAGFGGSPICWRLRFPNERYGGSQA